MTIRIESNSMLRRLLPLALLLTAGPAGAQSEDLDALTQAPQVMQYRPGCSCPVEDEAVNFLRGLIVDAEVTLAPNRLSINERQATIVNVESADNGVSGRTRVWHSNNTDACGVAFDYGKRYEIAVRELDDGSFETDACLMRRARN